MASRQTLMFRRVVYDVYAAMHDDLPAEHPGIELTAETCREIATQARRLIREATFTGKQGRKLFHANCKWVNAQRVHHWLSNPEFAPYVDKVAVDRALQFDASALAGLTELEREVLYTRLAGMDDPWSTGRGLLDEILREQMGEAHYPPKSQRRLAWEALPEPTRTVVNRGAARVRLAATAEPQAVAA